MEAGTSALRSVETIRRTGQACDRCRKKKIKCDGSFPTCRSCAKGGYLCEVSATLRRNTKVRGFTSDEQQFVQLQEELARCQQLLESEKAQNRALKSELSNSKQTISSLEKDLLNPRLAEPSTSRQNKSRQNEDSTYMIKHMGRLVHDEMGVGRFAGSTTGIHFVLTVEQQCQKVLNLSTGFPESCFRLFLAQTSPIRQNWTTNMPTGKQSELLASFNNPLSYYLDQADRFINEWEAYCPVLVRKQLMSDVRHTVETLHGSLNFQEIDPAMPLTILVILIINELCLDSGQQISSSHHRYLNMADTLINDIRARGDIKGLQALALCSLYYQLSGDCLGMTRIHGIMVSLAQSLGLHRHSRRFKMKPCEIELRKRLWWWIYSFDSVTSLIHGLPSLINDVDVDCDMPTDCHMDDLDAAELSHPLPGERTAVFLFIQYVALGKLLSRIRETLYTTTQRRNGATKINDLNLDLRMWNQNLKMTGIIFDIGTIPSPFLRNESAHENDRTVLWLQLLANTAMVFINRPGLSFDDSTVEFANCLRACIASSTANLSLLKEIRVPNWLQNMSLVSPGMVFQSALMHIYCQCYCLTLNLEGCPPLEASMDMISHAIFVLEKDRTDFQHIHAHQSFYEQSINEAVGTLQLLRSLLSTPEHIPAGNELNIGQDYVNQTPRTFDDQSWSANALDDLNYVLTTDWMYEVPEPFTGCMDLGAPEFG